MYSTYAAQYSVYPYVGEVSLKTVSDTADNPV